MTTTPISAHGAPSLVGRPGRPRSSTSRTRPGTALAAHPDAVAATTSSLRDAITTAGPAALAPAALGRLAVAVQCLADTATTAADGLPADLRDQIGRALAELAAYRHLAAEQRTRQP